jgi:4-hydroxybutyryl-CoA dehydratase/vinylacetyl-CoA-Delta-isomerase
MPLMTGEQYVESIRKMNRTIYFQGKKIENPVDDPILRPSMNCLIDTYDMALMPEYEDLMVTTSQFTGEKINRFNNIHRDKEDLNKKVKLHRLMGQRTASCYQRCVITDCANAFYSAAFEIDEACGTKYFDRFMKFILKVQKEDLIVAGALTDPKGDRSLPIGSSEQDEDLYLRVVEHRPDGVVVRGAKCHLTGATNAHEVVVLPTQALRKGQEDYAIAFSRNNTALRDAVDRALRELIADGTVQRIINKYIKSQETLVQKLEEHHKTAKHSARLPEISAHKSPPVW